MILLLVDEEALTSALQQGRLAGASIDTYEQIDIFAEELPPRLHPLTYMENVSLTAHVAAGSVQASEEIYLTGIQNALDILAGYWLLAENVVNPMVVPRLPLRGKS